MLVLQGKNLRYSSGPDGACQNCCSGHLPNFLLKDIEFSFSYNLGILRWSFSYDRLICSNTIDEIQSITPLE